MGEYRIFGTESGRSSNDLGIHAAIAAPRASGKKGIVFSTVAALLLSCATLANAQVPAVVISSAQTLYPSVGGNTHHVAVNSLGDVFYEDDGSSTIFELMPGNSTPIPLVVGVHGGRGVAVDASNNVFSVNNYDNGNAAIFEIPYSGAGGAYPTANISASLSGTNPPICNTVTGQVCAIYGQNGGSVPSYFQQVTDIGFDGKGNMYVVDNHDNVSGGSYNRILKYLASDIEAHYPNVLLMADNLPESSTATIAVDAAGDVYYADGISNSVYTFASGSTVAVGSTGPYTTIGTGLKTPGGVGVDAFGNLYISDTGNNRLVEMPYVSGVLQTTKQFLVSYTYSANGVAVDALGNIYFSGYANNHTTINELTRWNVNFGSLTVGTTSSTSTASFTFNTAGTPAAISISPASGPFAIVPGSTTCAVATAQAQGSSCTVGVTYTPSAAGAQSGAIVLSSASGAAIATAYLEGAGVGAAQTVDPGTVTPITGIWKSPKGIAIDSAHNVYVADSTANAVYEYSVSGSLLATIGSGLSKPSSVAVDAAGNVYIADSGNGRIVEVPVVSGALSNASQAVVYAGTSGASGISIDAVGNLYIADSGNAKVFRLPNTNGVPNSALATTVGSPTATNANFTLPLAVTSDLAGDVFIAGATNVVEVQAWTGTQSVIIGSLSAPGGIAVDASGALYIADTGNLRAIRIPNENGTLNPSDFINVGAGIAAPYAVAIDSNSNLYLTDNADNLVEQIVRTQGTLQFGSVNLNTTSGSQTATITNAGNKTLLLGTPFYTATGNTGVYSISNSATGSCVPGATLASSLDCTLSAVFSPTVKSNNQTETLAFTSSAVTPSSLILTGNGAFLVSTQLAVAVTSPASGNPAFGSPVTVTATLTATGGFGTYGAPTGKVTFSVDGQVQSSPTISAAGVASLQINSLAGGTHAIVASYSGDANYVSSSTTTPATVTVAQLATVSTFTIAGAAVTPLSATPGTSITLTATVTPQLTPFPSGTVTFVSGTTVLGHATLVSGVATLVTTTLPTGNLNVLASYSGDINYAASQSAITALDISPLTFTLTPATANLTVTNGGSGSLTFTATSLSGFGGGANGALMVVSCSGLPVNSSCAFTFTAPAGNPGLTGEGYGLFQGYPQQIGVMILTGQIPVTSPPNASYLQIPGIKMHVPASLAFLLILPVGLFRRKLWKKDSRWMLLVLFLVGSIGAVTVTGCGGHLLGTTPAGSTNVTVTVSATSGTLTVTQNAQIALTVQQ